MNFNKIIKSSERFLRTHWRKWTILAILAMIIYSGFIFYKYAYKSIYDSEQNGTQKLEIKEELYKSLMNQSIQKQNNLIEIFNKNYLNPFK